MPCAASACSATGIPEAYGGAGLTSEELTLAVHRSLAGRYGVPRALRRHIPASHRNRSSSTARPSRRRATCRASHQANSPAALR
ncbi:hypothetical protein ACTMU2_32850 [Cupriavidus basilensis]